MISREWNVSSVCHKILGTNTHYPSCLSKRPPIVKTALQDAMKPCIPNANQSNQALRIDLLIEQTPFPFDAGRPTSHIVDLGWLRPFQISPVRVITQNICHPKVQELGCGGVIQTGMSHACYFRPCIKCILQRACHCPKNVQQPHETIHH